MNSAARSKRISAAILIVLTSLTFALSQNIVERSPTSPSSSAPSKNYQQFVSTDDEMVKVASSSKVKRLERLTVPLGGNLMMPHLLRYGFSLSGPHWQAGAKLIGAEAESTVEGMTTFQPIPYSHDIKVIINATGLPAGKHALHIHTYGDLRDGCTSTGSQFPNNFIGNIDTKEDGSISASFISVYLSLFGFSGIVGRSIVIHSKPIDLNTALNAEFLSSSLLHVPDAIAYQNEENSVGPALACGVISIMSTQMTPQK